MLIIINGTFKLTLPFKFFLFLFFEVYKINNLFNKVTKKIVKLTSVNKVTKKKVKLTDVNKVTKKKYN